MIWLIGLLIFSLFWLYMTRVCIRWTIELDYRDDCSWSTLIWLSLLKWPKAIVNMLPAYLERDPRILHLLLGCVGESGWHRKQRLEEEHKERCKDMELPVS